MQEGLLAGLLGIAHDESYMSSESSDLCSAGVVIPSHLRISGFKPQQQNDPMQLVTTEGSSLALRCRC
jgi:hypothetical protein